MKSMRIMCCLCVALLCVVSMGVFGQDADIVNLSPVTNPATTSAAAATVSVVSSWVVTLIYVVCGIILAYGAWSGTKLINLVFGQQWAAGAHAGAITALAVGVQKAEEDLVNELKSDTVDGKLTAAEITLVKQHAYEAALAVAKGPAYDLLKTWGVELAGNWISQIVQGKKSAVVSTPVVVSLPSSNQLTPPATVAKDIKRAVETAKAVDVAKEQPIAKITEGPTTTPSVIQVCVPTMMPTALEIENAIATLAAANKMQVRNVPIN